MDAEPLDSTPADSITAVDGMSGDVPIADAGPLVPPTIASGYMEVGSTIIDAPAGLTYLDSVPFYFDKVKFITSAPMVETMIDATLFSVDGPVEVTMVFRDMAGGTAILLRPVSVSDIVNGWYCVRIQPTLGLSGMMLDGEWRRVFPSGNTFEGGAFVYGFGVLAGDIDGDGEVTMEDLDALGDAFGGSNPRYDLNGDGDINILDASLAGSNFGFRIDSHEVPTECSSAIPPP